MAELTIQNMSASASLTPTFTTPSVSGNTFINNGRIFLYLKNEYHLSTMVTIHSQVLCDHGTQHDITVTLPLGTSKLVGFFGVSRFNDVSAMVTVVFAGTTEMKIAAIRIN